MAMKSEAQAKHSTRALILVSAAVFLASSTWFSGTAATMRLIGLWQIPSSELGLLTTAVQVGFIVGTLVYAFFNLADHFNARRLFFLSALFGALFNAGFALLTSGLESGVLFRFLTGVTLAGIYPVGMRLVASWFRTGLGWRLGVMVGSLVLGTGLPYLIQFVGGASDWRLLSGLASLFAILGGVVILMFLHDGPYLTKRPPFDFKMMFKVFEHKPFRNIAFGYFGHMWELYAFWSLLSFYVAMSFERHQFEMRALVPLVSFMVIGMGAIGCALGGWFSQRIGERNVALISLLISATFCLGSGYLFLLQPVLLIAMLLIWGFFVVSDSPQFSALAAMNAPPEYMGTALTVQNGIGFAITSVSLQLMPVIAQQVGWQWTFLFLAAGPLAGAYFIHLVKNSK
ncbi:MFS transporter [Candidatus Acetothermia bacterium]|nr:MFS transporter [Candidatus Acetothermia bacterium]MBI3643445.1 MFS transporter [Candidatus Acetothermia bacterium]